MIVLFACFGVFSGAVWARTVGILVALGSAIANFAFLRYYPVWAILLIAVDIAVTWALTVHGRDVTEMSRCEARAIRTVGRGLADAGPFVPATGRPIP